MRDVVVVGAGAAGIMAAWRAATTGANVLLLEKTNRIGTKILISGGGKCNICHDGPIEDVLRAFRPNEARFIRPSVYRWPNVQIIEMLTSRGLEVYTRPDGRIFPVRQTAKDVVAILRQYLIEAGVSIRLESPVSGFRALPDGGFELDVPGDTVRASQLVLSVGGSSYPNSGTTGDGWAWAKRLGHTIAPVRAALAPIYLKPFETGGEEGFWTACSGVALRDIVVKARQAGKEIDRWRGDLLFTHHGVSGPCALAVSRVIAEKISAGPVTLEVDLLPDKTPESVSAWAGEYTQASPQRQIKSLADDVLVESLVAPFFEYAKVDPSTTIAQLDRKSRNRIVEALKAWRIGEVRAIPLEKGECVTGGVVLDEVDPHTMRSKFHDALYLCGEMLDIAGPVGGYNLQSAFATGYVAGESAAQSKSGSAEG